LVVLTKNNDSLIGYSTFQRRIQAVEASASANKKLMQVTQTEHHEVCVIRFVPETLRAINSPISEKKRSASAATPVVNWQNRCHGTIDPIKQNRCGGRN
jgi:hypothetical protein